MILMDNAAITNMLENHLNWLRGLDIGMRAVLRGDLRRTALRGANLCHATLRANLMGSDLRDADLTWVDMCGASLNRADLRGADLTGANLQRVDLTCADLRGANLRGADLRGADLRGAALQGADLRDVDMRFNIQD